MLTYSFVLFEHSGQRFWGDQPCRNISYFIICKTVGLKLSLVKVPGGPVSLWKHLLPFSQVHSLCPHCIACISTELSRASPETAAAIKPQVSSALCCILGPLCSPRALSMGDLSTLWPARSSSASVTPWLRTFPNGIKAKCLIGPSDAC